jgi:hypothetical protein
MITLYWDERSLPIKRNKFGVSPNGDTQVIYLENILIDSNVTMLVSELLAP